jgi:hypothetical protein
VAFSRATIRCEADAQVLSVPDVAIARLVRRYPEHGARLHGLLEQASETTGRTERLVR